MKRSEIRGHIIETASRLFYAQGYNATGINEIIAESGVAKATLYHHFRSKKELCIAYLQFRHKHFMEALRPYVLNRPAGRKQLLGIFDFLREFYRQPNFNGCWCMKTMAEIPRNQYDILEEIHGQKRELLEFIEQIVVTNMPTISRAESEKIANGLYLLFESALNESHLHQNDWPIFSAKAIGSQIIN